MPPLAPNPRDLLLIGAPRPVNELRAGNEQSEHGNRVNVVFTTALGDVSVSVADFDGWHLLNKARRTHTQTPPTRPAQNAAERDRLTFVCFRTQPNVATVSGPSSLVIANLSSGLASPEAAA